MPLSRLLSRVPREFARAMLVAILLVHLTSCVTGVPTDEQLAAASLGHSADPQIAVLYYPYTVSLDHRLAAPHPVYTSWPQHRMRQDLQRIAGTGLDLLVVHVEGAAVLSQSGLTEQYRSFVELASNADVRCVLYVDGSGLQASQGPELVQWLLGLRLPAATTYWKDAGRPIVLLTESEHLQVQHIGLDLQAWEWETAVRLARTTGLPKPLLTKDRRVLRIRAGWAEVRESNGKARTQWQVERAKGQTLRRALMVAAKLEPAIILVDSWNDYRHGSFIEPNSLDDQDVLRRFSDTVMEIRAAARQ